MHLLATTFKFSEHTNKMRIEALGASKKTMDVLNQTIKDLNFHTSNYADTYLRVIVFSGQSISEPAKISLKDYEDMANGYINMEDTESLP